MFRRYREIEKGEQFVVFGDTAAGGLDYCAAPFLSITKLDVPIVYHAKVLATEMTNTLHPALEKIYDITGKKPLVAYERNNGGVFELERLAALNRNGKFDIFKMPTYGKGWENGEAVKLGWETNTATRPKMLTDWKEVIDKGVVRIYDRMTIEEHFSFIVAQTSTSWKAQAEVGAHDDLVMAHAGAWQLRLNFKEPTGPVFSYANIKSLTNREADDVLGL